MAEEELNPSINKLKEIFEHLIVLIEKTDEDYTLPDSFNDFAKDNNIKVDGHKDWYELVYKTIWSSNSNSFWGVNIKPKFVIPISLQNQKERNALIDEIQILKGIKKVHEKILKDNIEVSGFWSGLAVLIYACILGIAIPSILFPYHLNTFNDRAIKQLLLGCFSAYTTF